MHRLWFPCREGKILCFLHGKAQGNTSGSGRTTKGVGSLYCVWLSHCGGASEMCGMCQARPEICVHRTRQAAGGRDVCSVR